MVVVETALTLPQRNMVQLCGRGSRFDYGRSNINNGHPGGVRVNNRSSVKWDYSQASYTQGEEDRRSYSLELSLMDSATDFGTEPLQLSHRLYKSQSPHQD